MLDCRGWRRRVTQMAALDGGLPESACKWQRRARPRGSGDLGYYARIIDIWRSISIDYVSGPHIFRRMTTKLRVASRAARDPPAPGRILANGLNVAQGTAARARLAKAEARPEPRARRRCAQRRPRARHSAQDVAGSCVRLVQHSVRRDRVHLCITRREW